MARYLPVADEVGRLQRGDDPECRFFQAIAEQGHYAGRTEPSDTRQGLYAFAPSGRFLASINTLSARAVARTLERGLEAWEALDDAERFGAPDPERPKVRRLEDLYPEGGLVLRVTTRDLPRGDGEDARRRSYWNQDLLWLRPAEARVLVPAKDEPGASQAWPEALAARLVRFHMVDVVRGQSPAFWPQSVEKAEIISRVEAASGDRVVLAIEGSARVRQKGTWAVAGFRDRERPSEQELRCDADLIGRATFDRKAGRFVSFVLVAKAMRAGATQFNNRARDPGPAPMGVSFTLAGDGPADRVAPAGIYQYGWK